MFSFFPVNPPQKGRPQQTEPFACQVLRQVAGSLYLSICVAADACGVDELAHAGSRPDLAGTVGGCHGLLQGWLLANTGGEVPMKLAWAIQKHTAPQLTLQSSAFGTPLKSCSESKTVAHNNAPLSLIQKGGWGRLGGAI